MSDNKLDLARKLGQRIRELRMSMGMSQEELAYNAGLHRTYMGQVERGKTNVSITNCAKVSGALSISLSTLFEGIRLEESSVPGSG